MAARRRPLTEEQRAQRRREDREFSRQAVEQLRGSQGWQQWLSSRKHFRGYSLHNQLLIAIQRPDARRVAGFRAWLRLGYAVKRGEKAIRIWVPIPPSRKQIERWEQEGSNPQERPRTYFKLGPVFDLCQVSPLPPPAQPTPVEPPVRELSGEQLTPIIPRLISFAGELGCTVSFNELHGPKGSYEIDSKHITIDSTIAINGQAKTLIHELSHALLRLEPTTDDPVLPRPVEELVVESVAYTVCATLGIDSSSYSIPYLTSWSQEGDIDAIEQTAGLIDRLARRIELALEIA